jgi:hypothetical protein
MRDRTGWPDRLRLPFAFDPALLARDLENLSAAEWIDHFLTDRYVGEWDVVPLRGPADAQHPIMMIAATPGAKSFKDTPALEACPYLRDIIDSFQTEIRGARLLRLTAGSELKEHTDHESTSEDGVLRIHIPVVTNPDVMFMLNGTRVVMDAGSAWYLRLSEPHSVVNRGTTDRVHLLVDMVMNERLAAVVNEAAYLAANTAVA